MPRYTGWKTVIDGAEKSHRSQNAAYAWLREKAADLPEGTTIDVQVREGARWLPYEKVTVRDGHLHF